MSSTLPVNEVFETVQGEGHHSGIPAVFIRMQGCPVGCPWCDTKHTWAVDIARAMEPLTLINTKTETSDSWASLSTDLLVQAVASRFSRHVVLTGGEPALYDLTDLSTTLIDQLDCTVQLETSGTHAVQIDPRAWVTVSPKIGMPGGFVVRDDALARADEIKMPVGKQSDIALLIDLLDQAKHRDDAVIYLQPISLSKKATDLCFAAAIANRWRVSIQTHAIAGWR